MKSPIVNSKIESGLPSLEIWQQKLLSSFELLCGHGFRRRQRLRRFLAPPNSAREIAQVASGRRRRQRRKLARDAPAGAPILWRRAPNTRQTVHGQDCIALQLRECAGRLTARCASPPLASREAQRSHVHGNRRSQPCDAGCLNSVQRRESLAADGCFV